MIFCHLGSRTGLSCHNVRGKKSGLQGFVDAREGLRTYLYDGTLTHMRTFFRFLSELYVTSGRGATRVGMDYYMSSDLSCLS